jgi:aldehyde:ferredoxin oxidoreductase
MMYGYAGRLLRVNLENGRIDIENVDPTVLKQYLGGAGLGAKILYDEVIPGCNGPTLKTV